MLWCFIEGFRKLIRQNCCPGLSLKNLEWQNSLAKFWSMTLRTTDNVTGALWLPSKEGTQCEGVGVGLREEGWGGHLLLCLYFSKANKASNFHIHEVCFVVTSCQINWVFNMQYVSHTPPHTHTLTIKKTQYQRVAHTQFHEPINTAFALITISAPWKEWSELSGRCSLLPDFIWWKWISCSSQI